MAGLHARGGQRLDHLGVDALEDLHQRANPVGFRVGQRPGVFGVERDEVLALALERDVRGHSGLTQLVLLCDHAGLSVHLGLADGTLLLLDGDFGVELALADGAFLLDGKVAPRKDRLVRALEDGLTRFRFERLGGVGRRLHAADRNAEDFKSQGGDVRAVPQSECDEVGDTVGGLQRFLQRELLHRLLGQHFHRTQDPLRQLLRIVGFIALAVGLEREVEHRGGPLRLADTIGDVALDGEGLKVAGDVLEDEGGVPASDRDGDQRGDGRVVQRG